MDAPAGVTQKEGHTGFLHLPSRVLALILISRRIHPFHSLVDHELYIHHLPYEFLARKIKASTAERRWMENPVLPSSCVTPAGTSIEVQNEWEENTHTHTTDCIRIIILYTAVMNSLYSTDCLNIDYSAAI